ncbi:hypothetical protein E2C01_041257 [Portunus trituberculatus]|uniref:Uncharacterized protein n=1 Tax=Portunus trituberculatus TaxID=210409 RepID=A0A5B7FRF8_PORTR|nr:hypothetical protein [Portunus trituberculatus]
MKDEMGEEEEEEKETSALTRINKNCSCDSEPRRKCGCECRGRERMGEREGQRKRGRERRGCEGLACLGEPTPFVRLLSIKVSNSPPNCKANIGSSSPLILMTVFPPRLGLHDPRPTSERNLGKQYQFLHRLLQCLHFHLRQRTQTPRFL